MVNGLGIVNKEHLALKMLLDPICTSRHGSAYPELAVNPRYGSVVLGHPLVKLPSLLIPELADMTYQN